MSRAATDNIIAHRRIVWNHEAEFSVIAAVNKPLGVVTVLEGDEGVLVAYADAIDVVVHGDMPVVTLNGELEVAM